MGKEGGERGEREGERGRGRDGGERERGKDGGERGREGERGGGRGKERERWNRGKEREREGERKADREGEGRRRQTEGERRKDEGDRERRREERKESSYVHVSIEGCHCKWRHYSLIRLEQLHPNTDTSKTRASVQHSVHSRMYVQWEPGVKALLLNSL